MGDPIQPGQSRASAAIPVSFFAEHCHRKHERPVRTNSHPIRVYDPKWSELYHGQISDIIDSCECCSDNKMRIGSATAGKLGASGGRIDGDTIVVSVAAAYQSAGDNGPRAACGAFYGPGSAKNEGFIVPDLPQNKQAAEIYAATSVLQDILKSLESPTSTKQDRPSVRLCKILILTESATLVQGISSDAFWEWKEDGFEMNRKPSVANAKLFMALDDMLEKFWDERKIPVWFWLVENGTFQDARILASERLKTIKGEPTSPVA